MISCCALCSISLISRNAKIERHCILLTCSQPYQIPSQSSISYHGFYPEQLADMMAKVLILFMCFLCAIEICHIKQKQIPSAYFQKVEECPQAQFLESVVSWCLNCHTCCSLTCFVLDRKTQVRTVLCSAMETQICNFT